MAAKTYRALTRIYLREDAPVVGTPELSLWPDRVGEDGEEIPADTITHAELLAAGQTDEDIANLVDGGALEVER